MKVREVPTESGLLIRPGSLILTDVPRWYPDGAGAIRCTICTCLQCAVKTIVGDFDQRNWGRAKLIHFLDPTNPVLIFAFYQSSPIPRAFRAMPDLHFINPQLVLQHQNIGVLSCAAFPTTCVRFIAPHMIKPPVFWKNVA